MIQELKKIPTLVPIYPHNWSPQKTFSLIYINVDFNKTLLKRGTVGIWIPDIQNLETPKNQDFCCSDFNCNYHLNTALFSSVFKWLRTIIWITDRWLKGTSVRVLVYNHLNISPQHELNAEHSTTGHTLTIWILD